MKLILIYFKSNAIERYGEVCALRQAMLFVFIPDRTATYDNNGYVTSVSYNGNTYSYTYDGIGRLTSETVDGSTTSYSYDNANNITQAGNTTFSYDNQNRLVQAGSETFSYDLMGNPTTYKGNEFVWEQGRKLTSGSMNGKNFSYRYDGNGMRYEKVVNGTKTQYYYDGTQLLMESKNGKRMWYIYGATGIEGMIREENYGESVYYFDKNTLGDIVAIRDLSGNVVATYEYDAWGNHTVYNGYGGTDYSASSIGNINPFRYRGYYYDTETGFYYLQTRYYDPAICRFINADTYELVVQLSCVPGQLNMYAYCGNNPIMHIDPMGTDWWHWVVGGAVVLLAGIAVVATAGGAAAGIGAVAAVLAGGSAATVGATVAAGVFIGASTTYIAMGIAAGISSIGSSSFSDSFAAYGEAAMWSTIGAGVLSGIGGYFSHVSYGTHTPKTLHPLGQYYNISSQTMTHYGFNGQMSWSKHFTNHGNSATHLYVPHYHAELPHYPPSGFENKRQLMVELILRLFERGHQ